MHRQNANTQETEQLKTGTKQEPEQNKNWTENRKAWDGDFRWPGTSQEHFLMYIYPGCYE